MTARISKRLFLIGGASLLFLAGCSKEEDVSASSSATRGNDRYAFRDVVSWIETGSRTAIFAFVPTILSPETRHAVLRNRGVYPAIEKHDPMIEMRVAFSENAEKFSIENIRSIQLTFWHFDSPSPVIRYEADELNQEDGIHVVGLDGIPLPNGWAVGSVRGQKILPTASGRNIAYTFNLSFQSNFSVI